MAADKQRMNLEALALEQFQRIANNYPFPNYRGTGLNNCFARRGMCAFQYGDLRVSTPDRQIIVEVESAGGVTNLAKYWYGLESGEIDKALTLLHIFKQASANDYASHMLVWDHLAEKMRAALGDRFRASRYTYTGAGDLERIGYQFEAMLKAARDQAPT